MSTAAEESFEWPRKILHMAVTSIAFALPFMEQWTAAALALAVVILSAWWIRRGFDRTHVVMRRGEGLTGGIVAYPCAILLGIWCPPYPAAAMAAWGVLGIGDAAGSLIGRATRRRGFDYPLPWNTEKSWAGSLALIVFGSAAAFGLLVFADSVETEGAQSGGRLAVLALAAGVGGAILESLNTRFPDNLRIVAGATAAYVVAEIIFS